MRTELEVATDFVTTILSKNVNAESVYALYEIHNGNKELLKEHMKAIKSILNKAIKELERNEK